MDLDEMVIARTIDLRLPELGEGIYEAELVEWRVKPGDEVKHGQCLAEVMTDKATMELPSPFSGRIVELTHQPGDEMKVGEVIATYMALMAEESSESLIGATPRSQRGTTPLRVAETPARRPNTANGNGISPGTTNKIRVQAAPSVRRMAGSLGIDLAAIPGTGPDGRVLIDDLTQYIKSIFTPVAESEELGVEGREPTIVRSADFMPGTRMKLRGVRRKVARHMVESKQKIPHFSYIDQCDVTELVRVRASLQGSYSESGVKLTYLPFVVKAVVAALAEIPLVNSTLDEDTDEIVFHDHFHIGIATDTPEGLVVPVVRDADRKDLMPLAREIQRLVSDARSGKLAAADFRGSTFTITSIGSIGGLITTPIINHPEVGILGIGKIVRQPVFDEADHVRAAHMVYLSYSFDHRVIDGAVAARFSNAVIKRLENPADDFEARETNDR